MHGGSFLGTQKQLPNAESLPKIAAQLEKHGIQALLMVGGFEVMRSLVILELSPFPLISLLLCLSTSLNLS